MGSLAVLSTCPFPTTFFPDQSASRVTEAGLRNVRIAVPWYQPDRNQTGRASGYYLHETHQWLVLAWCPVRVVGKRQSSDSIHCDGGDGGRQATLRAGMTDERTPPGPAGRACGRLPAAAGHGGGAVQRRRWLEPGRSRPGAACTSIR